MAIMNRIVVAMALSIAAFTALFTACTTEAVKAVPVEVVAEKGIAKIIEVPTVETIVKDLDPGELVLYSGRSESLVGNIVEHFEEATGIDVKVKYGKTFPVATMILEEGPNSPADIYFAQDPGGLGLLAKEGRLIELPGSITDRVAAWAKPKDGKWVGISGRARTLVHTATIDSADLPTSLDDLTEPKWKGKLGWAPTNSSFQTMITGMRASWGEAKTRQWLADMLANEPIVYPKNTPQVAAVAAEEISIGLVNHYYLHRFISEQGDTFNARNLYLSDGGPGSLVMVAGAGIVDTGKNRANAEKFLTFMTSKVAQQYFAGQIYEYPVVEGVKTHMLLTPLADINKPDLTIEDLSDLKGTQLIFRDLGMLD
ncbi:MAG: iron ABC transporter substrate-binding protein [Chloroflexota bacterium]|nr:iron ABC transporter substrate-binding protein [Chloroflexota bacterium]